MPKGKKGPVPQLSRKQVPFLEQSDSQIERHQCLFRWLHPCSAFYTNVDGRSYLCLQMSYSCGQSGPLRLGRAGGSLRERSVGSQGAAVIES